MRPSFDGISLAVCMRRCGSQTVMGVDHILFGSDYPHPEGLAEPCSYVDHLPEGLADEDVAAIMGGNLARLMRVEATTAA